jgi:transcriptional regulator with XRE-family HTH domain
MSVLAPKLRALLDRKGITARDLAGRIDMDESTVSLWLSGQRTPRVKNIEKLARALDVELAEIWSGSESEPQSPVQAAVVDEMKAMSETQQEAILAMIRAMKMGSGQ